MLKYSGGFANLERHYLRWPSSQVANLLEVWDVVRWEIGVVTKEPREIAVYDLASEKLLFKESRRKKSKIYVSGIEM